MSLISVAEALDKVLESVGGPLETERLSLSDCAGRVLAEDVAALRDQPPFPGSAMDGYAVRSADTTSAPVSLKLIGTSAAGSRFAGNVEPGQAVRIFTGAPLPDGSDAIVMQENTDPHDGAVLIKETVPTGRHIRPAGLDFKAHEVLVHSGEVLDARHIALAAAMGHGTLPVRRKPRVAILATGDELVLAGDPLGPDQITASSLPALMAMVAKAGAEAIDLGIARDALASLDEKIEAAKTCGADILVTLGGASVGDHDLVQQALLRQGMDLGFWRVALRPGKPLMHGKLGGMTLLGLPGNPVSSVVCAILFVIPAIHAMLGRAVREFIETVTLGADLPANGDRQDYLRARLEVDASDPRVTRAFAHPVQDSSMLAILSQSEALLIRAPHEPALKAEEPCKIIRLRCVC